MNFPVPNSLLERQRCRHWTPLFTQQLRLQHLFQIIAYNINTESRGAFYYTLHLTTMCAPFYTSEKINCSNPKWAELDSDNLPYLSLSAFVLRIWQSQENDMDLIKTTWGVNLSGLIYLGTKLSEIQPESFNENTVIFNMRGGFFSSLHSVRINLQKPLPFIDYLNITSSELETFIYRNIVIKVHRSEVKNSYKVANLQKLHSLLLSIRNKNSLVENLHETIANKCGLCKSSSSELVADNPSPLQRNSSQPLTMSALHKMLHWQQGKPPKLLLQQATNISKQIEIAKFKTRLLSQERDKRCAYVRQLKQKHTTLVDENEECGSLLMENYRQLSKDAEKLKESHRKQIKLKETLFQSNSQLFQRRSQLLSQLLFIYPIQQLSEYKWIINGIYLPNSENLSDCSDGGLAVALGYVSHILIMCSSLLQVPLRYPITYFGSRSYISDHITSALVEKDRVFPLYAGKDRIQFNYAVYLINKNIAQMRWVCGLFTVDLRATLSNLHTLLLGRPKGKRNSSSDISSDTGSINTSSTLNNFDIMPVQERRTRSPNRIKKNDTHSKRPGLSEILAIPEAFMSKEISSSTFKSYVNTEKFKQLSSSADTKEIESKASTSNGSEQLACLNNIIKSNHEYPVGIERGTDILHSCLNLANESKNELDVNKLPIIEEALKSKQNRHISRSVDSFKDGPSQLHTNTERGSDPLLNSGNIDLSSLEDGQQEFLQKWLDSGPALVCSDESLYPDEILGTSAPANTSGNSPLTLRTDALLNTTSFNLVKPK